MSIRRRGRNRGSRPLPDSGRSLLVTGLGYVRLPASLADLERWRMSWRDTASPDHAASLEALADRMAEAITTGRGTVDDADIGHMVIIHWPAGGDTVARAQELATAQYTTEAAIWQALGELAEAGFLIRCADDDGDDSCGDAGFRATFSPGDVIDEEFRRITSWISP